jgi:general secretion pathway protein D
MKCMQALLMAAVLTVPLAVSAAEPAVGSSANEVAGEVKSISMMELIDQVARRTGTQFVVDPRTRADVPLAGLDPRQVDLNRLRAILRVHQFVAIQEKGFVSVVPDANARQLPSRTYYNLNFSAPDDELVTIVLAGKSACAAQAVPVLRPLMPQAAHLAAMPPGSLIINDRALNARRIAEIFLKLDQTAAEKGCEWGDAKSSQK